MPLPTLPLFRWMLVLLAAVLTAASLGFASAGAAQAAEFEAVEWIDPGVETTVHAVDAPDPMELETGPIPAPMAVSPALPRGFDRRTCLPSPDCLPAPPLRPPPRA